MPEGYQLEEEKIPLNTRIYNKIVVSSKFMIRTNHIKCNLTRPNSTKLSCVKIKYIQLCVLPRIEMFKRLNQTFVTS